MRLPTIQNSLEIFKSLYSQKIHSVIDVGVMYGTDSLITEFRESKHFLFEPVKRFHSRIKENYKRAGINFELFDYAVYNESGKNYLHLLSLDLSGNIPHSHLLPEKSPEIFGEKLVDIVEVRVVTLDEWAKEVEIENPYIVKIDADGIEEKIIEGG